MSVQNYLHVLRKQFLALGISFEEAHDMSLDGAYTYIVHLGLHIDPGAKNSSHGVRSWFPQFGYDAVFRLMQQMDVPKSGKFFVPNKKQEAFIREWVPIVCANPWNRVIRQNCIERFKEL